MDSSKLKQSSFFELKRKLWFRFFHLFPFLNLEQTLRLQKFIKFFFGLSDRKAIKIEFCSLCNVRCVWCWMYYDSVNKPKGIMSYDDFKRFMELNLNYLLREKIRIVPFFNGETLLHPQIFQIFDDISKNKLTMGGLHSNLSLNLDIERLMGYPIVRFIVNVGGTTKEVHQNVMRGSDFELVIKNLRKMISINRDIVFVKINPTKDNVHQLKDFKKFMIDLGGFPENVMISDTGFVLPSLATREEKDDFFSQVVSENVSKYLRFTYSLDRNGDIIVKSKDKYKTCQFLMDAVAFDGRLTVCCHDQIGKINLGNVFNRPLEEIKKSDTYKKAYLKAKFKSFDFCKGCN